MRIQVAERHRIALQRGEVVLANADITVFEKDTYIKYTISGVYWNDSRGQTTTKNGIQISDCVVVYLYSEEYVPKAGDIIVKGIIGFEFDSKTQKAASESMKLFRTAFPDFAVVKSVDNCMYGGLPHIEIIAR